MKYLLDTNAFIHFINHHEPLSEKVFSQSTNEVAISGFTEAEIAFGVENSNPETREQTRMARSLILANFIRVYHDESISNAYGKLKAHLKQNNLYRPQNEFDLLIAATAIAKNLTLVTQNVKDFDQIPGLKYEDWSQCVVKNDIFCQEC